MDLSIYLQPVDVPDFDMEGVVHERRMGDVIDSYTEDGSFPDIENVDLAIIGVKITFFS